MGEYSKVCAFTRLPVGTYVAFSQRPKNDVFIVISLLLEMVVAISKFFIFVIVT